jgi:hypothetical protein
MMECERVRDEFIERLTGALDAGRARALDEHIAGCAACRTETERLREIWTELGALRVPEASGAAARVGRLVNARGAEGVGHPGARDGRGMRSTAMSRVVIGALAVAASVLVGIVIDRGLTRAPSVEKTALPVASVAVPKQRYVLLLHGPARALPASEQQSAADSVAEVAIVAEYRAWAIRLRDSGALVMAEKLADDPVTMLASSGATELPHGTRDELGGFFLIQAADSAEAFRIARECPHLKHGGTVQVRRIQPT